VKKFEKEKERKKEKLLFTKTFAQKTFNLNQGLTVNKGGDKFIILFFVFISRKHKESLIQIPKSTFL